MTRPAVPILPERVWRCYRGGRLLETLLGQPAPADGSFPEAWLGSTTRARNGPHQQHPDEGLSRIRAGGGVVGARLVELLGDDPVDWLGPAAGSEPALGVLVKLLDAAERLPVQCHPDRAFARRHYGSAHGKAEAWFVLGTRSRGAAPPAVYLGFRPGVAPADLREAVARQEIPALLGLLHRVPVAPGDAVFIPGGLPHAIGAGVLLLEVQEPTDWVVQVERRIGEVTLGDGEMWGPLSPEVALSCFDFSSAARGARDEILSRIRLAAVEIGRADSGGVERLVGPEITDCFRVERLTACGEVEYAPEAPYHLVVITSGVGTVAIGEQVLALSPGECVLVPYGSPAPRYAPEAGGLVVYLVAPGVAPRASGDRRAGA